MKESVITFENFTIVFKELYQDVFSVKFERDKTLPFSYVKLGELFNFFIHNTPNYEYLYFEDDDIFEFAKLIIKNVSPISYFDEITGHNIIRSLAFGKTVQEFFGMPVRPFGWSEEEWQEMKNSNK